MKSKKSIRVIAIILVLLMILPFLFDSLAAYAVTQDEINAIQSQKKELSEKVSSCKERLAALQSQQANVLEQRAAIMEENKLTQEQIDLVQAQIDIYDETASEIPHKSKGDGGKRRDEYPCPCSPDNKSQRAYVCG